MSRRLQAPFRAGSMRPGITRVVPEPDSGGAMGPGITWYDVLGALPGASAEEIRREYDSKASLLRPELIAGSPSTVVTAVSRAQGILDSAWRVVGDPVRRKGYDEAIGLRRRGGGLARCERFPSEPGGRSPASDCEA